jgi:hypothetical protein
MKKNISIIAVALACTASGFPQSSTMQKHSTNSTNRVQFSLYERARFDSWQWFAAPPQTSVYAYGESLLRVGIAQNLSHWNWKLELAQAAILNAPANAVSPITAQGQLGLGGTYYATSGNNIYPAAAFLKQGYVRLHSAGSAEALRIGRYEFLDGEETRPSNRTIAWLQTNRIAQRLIGNFGFSNAQRSFDGADGQYAIGRWNLTAMAARTDQGVFNMNGNPELNVDLQYLAVTRSAAQGHVLARAFGMGYHDGRTGVTKADNRPLAVRQADHGNIRLGTYGGNLLLAAPAGPGSFDFVFWGALQNGAWGTQNDRAGAAAVEGGYHLTSARSTPWLRAGWFRSTGDNNPVDKTHNTFFQILPTPRVYARTPFYNLMNSTDEFLQVIDQPARKVSLRADLHDLRLTSAKDLWYLGGGAWDNSAFGFTGRPANGHHSFASLLDASADWQAASNMALNFYYGRAWGRSIPESIYPTGQTLQYGYAEVVYRWGD